MPTPKSAARVLVGTTSTVALATNPSRHGCMFQNLSGTATIALSLVEGEVARIGYGINLTPGGVWTMDDNTITPSSISAIATEVDAPMSIQEYI